MWPVVEKQGQENEKGAGQKRERSKERERLSRLDRHKQDGIKEAWETMRKGGGGHMLW